MIQYLDLLRRILDEGVRKDDRTGTGTLSVFGHQMRFDLQQGFPLVTTKRVFWKGVVEEQLWMLRGETNVRSLQEKGVHIWDAWALKEEDLFRNPYDDRKVGDLGPVYGAQWRSWERFESYGPGADQLDSIDQITQVIEQLRTNPDSRRLIVTAWNPADLDQMALAPCHCFFQFNTRMIPFSERMEIAKPKMAVGVGDPFALITEQNFTPFLDRMGIPSRYLDCQLYQRSCDVFLGGPFNIASYALLTHLIAREVGMIPGHFVHTLGDAHLYTNHIEQAKLQLTREPRPLPMLAIRKEAGSIFDVTFDDLILAGYDPCDHISAPVAV